ncbi:MAG: DUF6198 family protein [Eubacteriales bacterium]|nr:DUF6198 family protein [Eubacteriales bacterium]
MGDNRKVLQQYLLFIIGLFISSVGVALSTKAGLGTSPVSSVPYSISLISTALTFGGFVNLFSIIQITIQVILLGRKCKPVEIAIQTVLALTFGYMTNFSCTLLRGVNPTTYIASFMLMILSCFVLALGIWVQLKGNVAMLPGEAMNRAISQVTGKKYENVKIFFDIVYILIAAAICLIFTGRLSGVREGSIIAAFAVGLIIKLYNKIFKKKSYIQKMRHTGAEKKWSLQYFYHDLARLVFIVWFAPWYRPIVLYENENAKKKIKGGAIITSNHQTFIDAARISGIVLPYRRIRYMGLARLFKRKSTRWLFPRLLMIPVDPEKTATATLREVINDINGGWVVGIFPEGHVNRDSVLSEFKEGTALFAQTTGCPVIPTYILAQKSRWERMICAIGEPVTFEAVTADVPKTEKRRAFMDELFRRTKELEAQCIANYDSRHKVPYR